MHCRSDGLLQPTAKAIMGVHPGAGTGLTRLVSPPEPRVLERVSPSSGADLLACQLRAGYRSDTRGGTWRASTAALLGLVCHEVLAESAKGQLGDPDNAEWRDRFDTAWTAAISRHV